MKKTYKIKGLDCGSCASMIEMDLEDVGIKSKCSFAKSSLEVELKDKSYEKKVFETVQKAGYRIE